jgi:phosphoenolpyruvate-protein phosphotransferase (PTS system enzyme I)
MPDLEPQEIILKGISGSPGICIGKAYIVDKEGVDVVEKYLINGHHLENEKNRFKTAVRKAKDELHGIIEDTPEELRQHTKILETHVLLLEDKLLYGRTIETIEKDRVNAEWALKKVVSSVRPMFESMSDPYLRERASDILHVSDRIMGNLVGAKPLNIKNIDKRVILVAHDLSPAETSQIQLERIKGFVTDRGGKSSHTSIIASSLGIPAVPGLDNATRIIKNDDIIVVDGTRGVVILNPTEQTIIEYSELQARYEEYKAVFTRSSHLPAVSTDNFRLLVMGNIELPEEVFSVMENGGEGIGLYRTEFQYLSRSKFPEEDELFDKYQDVVEVMEEKPVTIRTLDINGDKAMATSLFYEEKNPVLGLRAIRYCLKKPDVFKTQLRAILRAAAYGKVRVLIPMISNCDEIKETKIMLEEAARSLEKNGSDFNTDIELGIMVEVPSAVVMADVMAREVDFFSIGTNDLIQYSLAIDRGNEEVAHLYNPMHPAIIRMIKHVSDAAKENDIKVFMCGEMAGDPINMPILLGLGMDELSMNSQSIPVAKQMIRSLCVGDAQKFMQEVLKQRTADDILDMVKTTYGSILANKEYSH